jgi:predicted O-linked N-acetylglucosamine transferase (SPINDLY family)
VAASLLHASGLDELACRDVASYEQTVQQLAADAARRARLRERLVVQRRHPLFDGRRFARDIEALFLRMWARALAGQAPEHLPAES